MTPRQISDVEVEFGRREDCLDVRRHERTKKESYLDLLFKINSIALTSFLMHDERREFSSSEGEKLKFDD